MVLASKVLNYRGFYLTSAAQCPSYYQSMSTHFTRTEDISRDWFVVDAQDQTVGRLASKLAKILTGKHKPSFTPHIDDGDYVVVLNAEKVRFTGNKWEEKRYYRHTGFMGGLKFRTASELLEKAPTEILRKAVWGMLSKSDLSRRQLMKLKIYAGSEHPHGAQNPKTLSLS